MAEIVDFKLPRHLAERISARRRESTIVIVALLVAALALAGTGLIIGPINRIRMERQLVIDPASVKNLPPDVALLGKLGTFRALVIVWASIRAERLKEEGKTYEALQLHQTACALAPRFPRLWAYAAWNMAYNISVSQYTPEARWKWVQNGITILRDQGLQFNPRSVTLYKELSWIFWHKIGDFLDDEHLNYKRALAVEWEALLGPPPMRLSDQEYFDWFRKIVDAPRNLDGLIREDEDVARLVRKLREVQLSPDDSLLTFVARHVRPELRADELAIDPRVDPATAARLEVVRAPDHQPALERLLAAIRGHLLRERYKMDVDFMYELMAEQYGPLDWRNAFSHSLYWSSVGNEVSKEMVRIDPADAMNNARFIFFSLNNMVTRGRIVLFPNFDDPFKSYIELTPDTRFIPYLFDTYMRLGKEQFGGDPRFREGTPGPNYMTGFVTNMHNWIELLYLEGGQKNLDMAENFYAWLREYNRHPDGSVQERYLVPLDQFVMADIIEQLQTYRAAGAILRTFVRLALKQFALEQIQAGVTSMTRARQCYNIWMADTRQDINDRRKMQPPALILRDEVAVFMQDQQIDPLFKARLWKNLPLDQRRMVYDYLLPYLERLCAAQQPPWSLERAFPEPPGMEEFRRTEQTWRGPARRDDLEQGQRFRR